MPSNSADYNRAWLLAHPGYFSDKSREYRRIHREKVLEDDRVRVREERRKRIESMGGRCVRCGATENLQFDHIDPSTKLFNISDHHRYVAVKEEIKKCQLLCVSCHREKTKGEMPEGGWSAHQKAI